MTIDAVSKIQDLVEPWWEETENRELETGRLAWTFVPYPEVQTKGLVLEGRSDPHDHTKARFRVEPLSAGRLPKSPNKLPVAALTKRKGESYVAQRGKRRPVLVLSLGGEEVSKSVSKGGPGYLRKTCVLVLPYYGADKDGKRAGFNEEFLRRIRSIEYPQYMIDSIPISGSKISVLRFDHVLAVGRESSNFELTNYRICQDAIEVIFDWFKWLVEGVLPEDGLLSLARDEITKINRIS